MADFRASPANGVRLNPRHRHLKLRASDGQEVNVSDAGTEEDLTDWPERLKRCTACGLIVIRNTTLHKQMERRWHQVGDEIHEWEQQHECDPVAPDRCPIVHDDEADPS